MKICNKCNVTKELTEFYNHSKHRDGKASTCKPCHNKARKNYYQANKDREKELAALWIKNNPEKHREYYKNYYNNNRHKEVHRGRLKQLKRKQNVPSWADMQAIKAIYDEAKRLTLMHGTPYHVDHIIPLQGKLVSGLHVHTNLRVLPAKDNLSKSNTYDPINTDIGV
jgi:hypothetical protein